MCTNVTLSVNCHFKAGKMADAMFGFCKSNSNIPISHLDYVYIRKCNDAKELECLLKILRYFIFQPLFSQHMLLLSCF